MRKKEAINVHALLVEVIRQLNEHEGVAVEVHSAYDALDVRPSSVHESKQKHHEAVAILGDSIERSLDEAHTGSADWRANRPR
jgi:hypothetical protein